MTQVIHGLTRKQLVEEVYGENPPPMPKKRRNKKYNATEAMVIWINGMNKIYGEDPSKIREQEDLKPPAGHQPVKRG